MPDFRTPLTRFLLVPLGIVAVVGVMAAGYMAVQDEYTIYDEAETITVRGSFDSVSEVLEAAEIHIRSQDQIRPALSAPVSPETAIRIERASVVTLRTEEGSQSFWTHLPTLGAFLMEAGIDVQRTDQIFADGDQIAFNALDRIGLPSTVEIGAFKTITIHDDGNQRTLRTAAQTVGAALEEAGIDLFAADGVQPAPGAWLEPDMHVYVQRSMPLTIHADGRVIQTRSHHTNSLDVLADLGIGLVGMDYARPGPEETLEPNDVIEVIRVTEDFRTVDEPIPYETLFQPTDQLEIDNRAVLQSGIPGIRRQRIRVRYENGVAVSETADGEWVAREPLNEIIGYGTKIVVRAIETPNGYFEYWRKVRMRVTSYTAASSGKPPDHPAYGITASGVRAGTGIVAVDPRVVPFRSWVYVPDYGTGYAGDTGGGVKGRWIDLGYDEGDYESWSGYVDVYYLTPVPAPEDINYLIPTYLP